MGTITFRPNGCSAGVAGCNGGKGGVRAASMGWTAASARGNARFLQSIDFTACEEYRGVAWTLTVRQVPPTPDDWKRRIKALLDWARRFDPEVRYHWVTEWTKKRRPHLHGMFLTRRSPVLLADDLVHFWLDLTWDLGTNDRAQWAVKVQDDLRLGWLLYVAKHAGRGAAHYQREKTDLPPGWHKTGRMWGRGGDWPTSEHKVEVDEFILYPFRRMIRAHARARARVDLEKARRRGDEKAVEAALRGISKCRAMLKTGDRKASGVRGVGGFIPYDVSEAMLSQACSLAGLPPDATDQPSSFLRWARRDPRR